MFKSHDECPEILSVCREKKMNLFTKMMWKLRFAMLMNSPLWSTACLRKTNHHFLYKHLTPNQLCLTEINVKISTCKENIYSKPFELQLFERSCLSREMADEIGHILWDSERRGEGGHILETMPPTFTSEGCFFSFFRNYLLGMTSSHNASFHFFEMMTPTQTSFISGKKTFYVAVYLASLSLLLALPCPPSISTRHWSLCYQALCYLGALPT